MYNLLISGNEDEWKGSPFVVESHRCVWEYTDDQLIDVYKPNGSDGIHRFNIDRLPELFEIPSIFCYESGRDGHPSIGRITAVDQIGTKVRVQYKITDRPGWLTNDLIYSNPTSFRLDNDWEQNRTHWALKNADLSAELRLLGFSLPDIDLSAFPIVDIDSHNFHVAFSFAGSNRADVSEIANLVMSELGGSTLFYDDYYTPYLARPNLDTLLQDIYGRRSKLLVIFLGKEYNDRAWTDIEWRAIRPLIQNKPHQEIMFIRFDDGDVEGLTAIDGYVDARKFRNEDIAKMIILRSNQLRKFE